ncbi:hypothetical protein AB6D66_01270 [Vibrio pomeroyi]|uniref:Uncharacterized protein n=1 Tax=Vibrio pomeroyi TaxID=198832 RepID=A0ABV4MRB1_9VIBR|nr:hypothetical protein [Vibrio atlanticus]MCZ4310245.1 hypothetical protein [Vibrio atlanticus]
MKKSISVRYKGIVDRIVSKESSGFDHHVSFDMPDASGLGWGSLDDVVSISRKIPVVPQPYNFMMALVATFALSLFLIYIEDSEILAGFLGMVGSFGGKYIEFEPASYNKEIIQLCALYIFCYSFSFMYHGFILGWGRAYIWGLTAPFHGILISVALFAATYVYEPLNQSLLTCLTQLVANNFKLHWSTQDSYHLINFAVACAFTFPLGLVHARLRQKRNPDFEQQQTRNYDANTFMKLYAASYEKWHSLNAEATEHYKQAVVHEQTLSQIVNQFISKKEVEVLEKLFIDRAYSDFWKQAQMLVRLLGNGLESINLHQSHLAEFHNKVGTVETSFPAIDSRYSLLFLKALEPQMVTLNALIGKATADREFRSQLESMNNTLEIALGEGEFSQKVLEISDKIESRQQYVEASNRNEGTRSNESIVGGNNLASDMNAAYDLICDQLKWATSK